MSRNMELIKVMDVHPNNEDQFEIVQIPYQDGSRNTKGNVHLSVEISRGTLSLRNTKKI